MINVLVAIAILGMIFGHSSEERYDEDREPERYDTNEHNYEDFARECMERENRMREEKAQRDAKWREEYEHIKLLRNCYAFMVVVKNCKHGRNNMERKIVKAQSESQARAKLQNLGYEIKSKCSYSPRDYPDIY